MEEQIYRSIYPVDEENNWLLLEVVVIIEEVGSEWEKSNTQIIYVKRSNWLKVI